MDKKISFAISEINNFVNDDNPELAMARVKFLSTAVNSHKINITKNILKHDASTVLGKFLVGRMNSCDDDCEGHEDDEIIFGYFPTTQEVKFKQNDRGEYVAIADAVVSKLYATSFYNIFSKDNDRDVSVEMTLQGMQERGDGSVDIEGFNITAVTVLGKSIHGSCPDARMSIIRFSDNQTKEVCEKYYKSIWERFEESELDKFVKNRKVKLEGKSYSVNTTELKDTPWGDVDKVEIRDKIMEASNRAELVKRVYLKVMDGWEDAPSENLKYPVMELIDDTFYYNKFALASALAYAKQHDETEVVSEIMKLYKKFDLAKEGEEENMSDKNFEIEGREAWADIIAEVQEHEGEEAYVESVEKDHIIFTIDDVRYRVDADIEVGEDDDEVKADIHWDTKKEDEDQDMSEDAEEDAKKDEEEENLEDDNEPSEDDEMADEAKEEEAEAEEETVDEEAEEEEAEEETVEEEAEEDMADADKIKELEDIIMERIRSLKNLEHTKKKKKIARETLKYKRCLERLRDV